MYSTCICMGRMRDMRWFMVETGRMVMMRLMILSIESDDLRSDRSGICLDSFAIQWIHLDCKVLVLLSADWESLVIGQPSWSTFPSNQSVTSLITVTSSLFYGDVKSETLTPFWNPSLFLSDLGVWFRVRLLSLTHSHLGKDFIFFHWYVCVYVWLHALVLAINNVCILCLEA